MRLGRAIIAAALVAAAQGAPARAASAPLPPDAGPDYVTSASEDIAAGPRLAGDALFLGELRSTVVLRLASADEPDRRLLSRLAPDNRFDEWGAYSAGRLAIAASPERLAYAEADSIGNTRYQYSSSNARLYGGTPSGPFDPIAKCHSDGWPVRASAALDVDGARVGSVDCDGTIVIRDYGGGGEPAVRTLAVVKTGTVGRLALAGDYLAFTDWESKTHVYNWVLGTELYATAPFEGFDLAPDGTLAGAMAGAGAACLKGQLAWHSPAEPAEHVLPVKPCTADVRIADGRIAAILPGTSGKRVLELVGLDASRTQVARLGTQKMRRGRIDYDGARVAYALRNCFGDSDLYTESATEPVLRDEPAACPVRLNGYDTAFGPTEKTILIGVSCPRDCVGRAVIYARLNGKLRTVAARTVQPGSCGSDVFRFRLSAPARAEARRRGGLAARLVVTNRDRDGTRRVTKLGLRIKVAPRDRLVEPGQCADLSRACARHSPAMG